MLLGGEELPLWSCISAKLTPSILYSLALLVPVLCTTVRLRFHDYFLANPATATVQTEEDTVPRLWTITRKTAFSLLPPNLPRGTSVAPPVAAAILASSQLRHPQALIAAPKRPVRHSHVEDGVLQISRIDETIPVRRHRYHRNPFRPSGVIPKRLLRMPSGGCVASRIRFGMLFPSVEQQGK